MLVNKMNCSVEVKCSICTMLHFVRSVYLDIWHIERYVCFWPLSFSEPTILSTVITFSSLRVCFSLPVSCRCLVLYVSQIFVNNIPTVSLLQFIFKNFASIFWKLYFLNRYKFLIVALSSLLNGTLHHRYIVNALKIIIYDNIICFCSPTSEIYLKLNII